MKPRLLIIFLLIMAIPIGGLGWLGRRIARAEEMELKQNLNTLYLSKLRSYETVINKQLEKRRQHLERMSDSVTAQYDPEAYRRIVRSDALLSQLFLLAPDGHLQYPLSGTPLTSQEEDFLLRTGRIWSSRLIPAASAHSQLYNLQVESADLVNNARYQQAQQILTLEEDQLQQAVPSQQKRKKKVLSLDSLSKDNSVPETELEASGGWISWYWESGIHMMYWLRLEDGRVLGAEFDRARLIADVIAELPGTSPGDPLALDERIALVNANDQTIYQWGAFTPDEAAEPALNLQLKAPLGAWALRYYPGPNAVSPGFGKRAGLVFNVTLTVLALAFLLLAVAFYREYSREVREATTRVSFVNRVSHELKTPLTNIRMYAELLENSLDDADERTCRQLGIIVGEVERLSRLIHNVLTFSKKDRSKLAIHRRKASLDELVEGGVKRFQPAFQARNIEVTLKLDAAAPVLIDPDAVEQILTNLLSNVEKYAGDGSHARVETQLNGESATIKVEDDGPGIPLKFAERVFRPFERLDDRLSEGVSGTGIGLPIARELARLHGGDLTLCNASSKTGACFQIILNVGEPE